MKSRSYPRMCSDNPTLLRYTPSRNCFLCHMPGARRDISNWPEMMQRSKTAKNFLLQNSSPTVAKSNAAFCLKTNAAYLCRGMHRTRFAIIAAFLAWGGSLSTFVARIIFAELVVAGIVDLPFRITTCRFLLAIVFRTWDLVCINLSFASRDFVCPRMTSNRIAFGFVHRRGHHAFSESSCVSLAHGPRWLFLLSRHRKAFLLLLIRSLL